VAIDGDAVVHEVDVLAALDDVEDHALVGVRDPDERIHVVDLGHPALGRDDRAGRHDPVAVPARDALGQAATAGGPGEKRAGQEKGGERDADSE
jgi:hypothetical protein